jgi:transketolase
LATLPNSASTTLAGVIRGGYVVKAANQETPDGLLIAIGSEVNLALAAQAQLAAEGQAVSVVSLPSFDRFAAQDAVYQESVLPAGVTKRLSIEAGATFGWAQYVGNQGASLGIDRFGASAPGDTNLQKFGFTVENVVAKFKAL